MNSNSEFIIPIIELTGTCQTQPGNPANDSHIWCYSKVWLDINGFKYLSIGSTNKSVTIEIMDSSNEILKTTQMNTDSIISLNVLGASKIRMSISSDQHYTGGVGNIYYDAPKITINNIKLSNSI